MSSIILAVGAITAIFIKLSLERQQLDDEHVSNHNGLLSRLPQLLTTAE